MLKNIHIQNYKLFKDFNLKDLPPVLLIGGKNNSGKTSLLEAIFFPLDCSNPGMFTRLLKWRGVDSIDISSVFTSAYHNFKAHQPMVFEYTVNSSKQKLQYEFLSPSTQPLNIHNGSVIELQKSPDQNMSGIKISFWLNGKKSQFDSFLKPEINRFSLKEVPKPKDYVTTKAVFMNSTVLSGSVEENAQRYGELDKINKTEGIVSSLQILEPKLKSLSVIPTGDKSALYGDIGMENKIHLNLMGQGIIRLVSILLGISDSENGVVLIDELENGFHHSVLPRMWEVITTHAKRCNTQIIATTHSWELISSAIEGVPKDLRSDFQYRRIEKGKNSVFKTVDYDFSTLKTAIMSHLETR